MEHLRACYSKSPLDTKAVIILPYWPKFKAVTKELKLIKQLPKGEEKKEKNPLQEGMRRTSGTPKGEKVFMRTTPTGTHTTSDIITSAWVINYWLIDANTHILSY